MMLKTLARVVLAACACAGSVALPAFGAPPDWLLGVEQVETPKLPSEVPAVVLRDETVTTVDNDGNSTTRHRYALRILNQSGRKYATGLVGFVEKEDHVRSTSAWLVRGGKEVRPKEKIGWIDVSAAQDGAVFSEDRNLVVNYSDFAVIGDVFGFETVVERKLLFPGLDCGWEAELPVLYDSYTLQLPAGWNMKSVLDGPSASAVRTTADSQRWTWELLNSPYRPEEPHETEGARIDAHLMITLAPAVGAAPALLPAFRTWAEEIAWLCLLQDGQCDSSPALIEASRQLTAGTTDALGQMRALSRYVQSLRYLSYDKGLRKGFGYRPRKASEVFAKGWGDCKAKANLLRAMLRTVGIDSFLVQINAVLGSRINDAWPAPQQFNHAILAIKVDDAIDLPAVVSIPKLGRVLFFDATNPDVLLGDLPSYLQGAKAGVVAAGVEGLATLPTLPAKSHHLWARQVKLILNASGAVTGECNYGGPGSAGAFYRYGSRSLSAKDFHAKITKHINATVSGASVVDLTTSDDPITGDCRVKFSFSAPHFAQMMPGGLAVVRLDVLSRDTVPAFPAKERRLPIALELMLQQDEVTLTLPSGYVVDEMPDHVELSSPYGHYESSYEHANGQVVARRTLKLEDRVVPVSEYAAVRKFLGDVAKADHSSVVLRKSE